MGGKKKILRQKMYWKQNLNGNFNSKWTFCRFLLSFIIKKFLRLLKKTNVNDWEKIIGQKL